MLQTMRDKMKGTVAIVIVGFLALIMALSLINLNMGGSQEHQQEVASVDGRTITKESWIMPSFKNANNFSD